MGADNHLTVVPRDVDADDGNDEEHSDDNDVTPNYGVVRSHGATERGDDSEVLR